MKKRSNGRGPVLTGGRTLTSDDLVQVRGGVTVTVTVMSLDAKDGKKHFD